MLAGPNCGWLVAAPRKNVKGVGDWSHRRWAQASGRRSLDASLGSLAILGLRSGGWVTAP